MPPRDASFEAVRACAIAILAGTVVQAERVTAGRGSVVDWRTVKSGESLQANADAFDTAQLFVALVGPEAALASLEGFSEEAPPVAALPPRIAAYMPAANGGRRRSFDVGAFRVIVEPHEDDGAQAAFTERLAELAASRGAA